MKALDMAREVYDVEIAALQNCRDRLLGDAFESMVRAVLECRGKVVFTGMGKSGHVARKVSATMASLGTPSFFLHPGEGMHGDLGSVEGDDLVVAISFSGESAEVVSLIPSLQIIGARIACITGNPDSALARASEIVQVFPNTREACHLGLAPSTSTTLTLVYGDALSIAVSRLKGFGRNDFGVFHPAGSLGKALTVRVSDLAERMPSGLMARPEDSVADVAARFGAARTPLVPVVDGSSRLVGVLTTSKVAELVSGRRDLYSVPVGDVMKRFPVHVDADDFAVDALRAMQERGFVCIPAVKDGRVYGVLSAEQVRRAGIYA